MSAPSLTYLRSCLLILVVLCTGSTMAQNAFSDSLAQVSERIRERLVEQDKRRVAVVEIIAPAGNISPIMLTYIEETLVARLVQRGGLIVLERRQLDILQDEQRRSASGTFDESKAIDLGRLLAADAIITGRVFEVDKKMHLMLRMLDTGTGVLLGSAETYTAFPRGKDVSVQEPKPQTTAPPARQPVRLKRDGPGSQRNSIVEMRVMGLGSTYFNSFKPGGALEVAVRAREQNSGVAVPGKVAIGLQVGLWPGIVQLAETPFDIGHIADLRTTNDLFGSPTIRVGSSEMGRGRLFLTPREGAVVYFQPIAGPNEDGTELLEYDQYKLSNVRMDMASFDIPMRWYMGENHIYDNVPKLYMEFGFGMDVVRTQADYEVTNLLLRLDRSDYSYSVQVDQFTDVKPSLSSVGSNLWFTKFSFGGGLEIGRFNVFAQGRWYMRSKFSELGRSYDRVRGNILAYPFLVGAQNDRRAMNDLERDGAVPYGATDLERVGTNDSSVNGTPTTVTGNGVDRFWQGRHFVFGVAFRFL